MASSSDRMAFRYVRESSFGNPASEPAKTLLYTRESLTPQFEYFESETILGDRQVRGATRSGRTVSGDVDTELIYGNLDDLLEGALADTWSSDVLVNGSDLISFALEKDFQDVNIRTQFFGCRVGSLAVNMPIAAPITATVGFVGSSFLVPSGGTSIGVGQPAASVSNEEIPTLGNLKIEEGGASPALEYATEFSFNADNGLRPQRVLGNTGLRGIGLGTFRVTGQLAVYFEDTRFIDKLIGDTPSEFEIVTTDSAGNSYVFSFPRLKFTGSNGPNSEGRNSDVFTRLDWTALRDPSTGITMRVERHSA